LVASLDPLARPYAGWIVLTTEEKRVEEKQKEFLRPLSWSDHHNLARDGYIGNTCCCVQARFLGMETKIHFPLL
jgi:hypothetical protein